MPVQPTPSSKIRLYAWLVAIAGLLLLLAGITVYFLTRTWGWGIQVGIGLGGALMFGAVLLRPGAVRTALTGRSVKYGSNAVVMSLAFIGILACINYLSHKNDREYDLTETGQFTLSQQTIKILENIEQPVQIIGFFQANDPALERARDYLERYSQYSDQLAFEFHDPNREPALAKSLELSSYGALIFISGDDQYEVPRINEQGITSGLIRVTNGQPGTLYFVTGHGEHSIDDTGPEGYHRVKQALEQENYGVNKLNLASLSDAVPSDATALIIAGSDHPFLETEVELLKRWMDNGGRLMMLIDPLEPVPLAPMLRQQYDLVIKENIVIEDYDHALVTLGPEGLTPQVIAPMIIEYPYHEITSDLDGYQSFYPFARSIAIPSTNTAAQQISPFLTTSDHSWAEKNLQAPKPDYTEGVDDYGPFHLGVTVEDFERDARLVIIGNAGFVTNQNVSSEMANLDIFINAVNWLAEEEELISIRPKQPTNRRLFLTPMQINITLFTTLVLIPMVIFATGFGIWWKRR